EGRVVGRVGLRHDAQDQGGGRLRRGGLLQPDGVGDVDLEVEVRPGGVAVVPHLGDDLAGTHPLPRLDEHTVGVHVDVPAVERGAGDLVLDDDELAGAAQASRPGVDDSAVGQRVD